MKKIISLMIVAAMMLGMCGITAFAGDGDQPQPTVGPADSVFIYGGARCGIYDTRMQDYKYVLSFDYDEAHLAVNNEAVPGMTYDMDTNTLTVTDVHQRDNQLVVGYMGNDFKLNVVGENEFGEICVYNYFNFHSTSLNIVGTGSLTVNEQQNNDNAIYIFGEGIDPLMGLDIADGVTVHLYSGAVEEGEDAKPVVFLDRSVTAPADGGAITLGGQAISEVNHEQVTVTDCDYVYAAKVTDTDKDINNGLMAVSKTDPDGVYSLVITDSVLYIVRHWIYLDSLGLWINDPEFYDQGFVGKKYSKEEFEAAYDYVYGMAPAQINYLSEYAMNWRGTDGLKMHNDDDPDALYVAVPAIGMWAWEDEEHYTGSYVISRVLWDDAQGMYVEDPSFETIGLMADEIEESGFYFEKENVFEPAYLTVWTSGDPADTSRFDILARGMDRASDPEGLYVRNGTYGSTGDSNGGILVYKVHYNPETEEHYIEYGSYEEPECFFVANADIENGQSDFSYAGEMVSKCVELRYLSKDYNIQYSLSSAIELKKADDPGTVYAYTHWTHSYGNNTEQEIYGIMRLLYNENLGCYVEDTDFDQIEITDLDLLDSMGFEIVQKEQPLDYTTRGRLTLSEYPAYTDDNGKQYYADYDDNVFSYSDDDTIVLGNTTYYFGTPEPELRINDLNDTEHDILTDTYKYWLDGPAYHHVAAAPSGFTVSGTITSYLSGTDAITATLSDANNTFTLTPEQTIVEDDGEGYVETEAAISFANVPAGTYTLSIEKKNHVTRDYEVVVSDQTEPLEAKICPLGDINNDGDVTMKDYAKAYKHAQEIDTVTGYNLLCGDVVGDDGEILMKDYAKIYKHVQEISSLWS